MKFNSTGIKIVEDILMELSMKGTVVLSREHNYYTAKFIPFDSPVTISVTEASAVKAILCLSWTVHGL